MPHGFSGVSFFRCVMWQNKGWRIILTHLTLLHLSLCSSMHSLCVCVGKQWISRVSTVIAVCFTIKQIILQKPKVESHLMSVEWIAESTSLLSLSVPLKSDWACPFLFFIYFSLFVEAFLRLTAASSSPHLILNQLCWLVLTLYFSYFTGSCRSRSPRGLENPIERGRAATRRGRGKDLQNENVKRSYGKRVRVCKCPCSKRRKEKKMSKWVWYWVIIMAAVSNERNGESRKLRV